MPVCPDRLKLRTPSWHRHKYLSKSSVIMNMTTGTSRSQIGSNVGVMGERPWAICEPNITELLLDLQRLKSRRPRINLSTAWVPVCDYMTIKWLLCPALVSLIFLCANYCMMNACPIDYVSALFMHVFVCRNFNSRSSFSFQSWERKRFEEEGQAVSSGKWRKEREWAEQGERRETRKWRWRLW